MEQVKQIMIPTRSKAKISHLLSFPVELKESQRPSRTLPRLQSYSCTSTRIAGGTFVPEDTHASASSIPAVARRWLNGLQIQRKSRCSTGGKSVSTQFRKSIVILSSNSLLTSLFPRSTNGSARVLSFSSRESTALHSALKN